MGYPAFILPSDPLTVEQIENDPKLRKLATHPRSKQDLLNGNPGELYWHQLPENLKAELLDFMEEYSVPEGELDPACIWLDKETRLCKHHQYRPRVCRDFEIGSPGCQEWRKFYRNEIRTS